jgi:iron complex transport system ATP-binding protein
MSSSINSPMSCLELKQLRVEIGDKIVCKDLSLTIAPNERWALLGKNGVGKTTLLHSLLSLHKPVAGEIRINNTPLINLSRRALARTVGMLFQEGLASLSATVMETVLLGRHPHTQSLLTDSPEDIAIATAALESLELTSLADRQLDTLSGGEKQRLALAMLMAQTPQLFLLDEPSNHLDLAFQLRLLRVLEQRLDSQAACLLMATHDINLAARFCNRFLLLMGNGEWAAGTRDEVLTEARLSSAYDCPMRAITVDDNHFYFPELPVI